MTKNYRVYVDRGGKMPQLKHTVWDCVTHPYYIKYVNDRPVAYHGARNVIANNVTNDGVYCYLTDTFVPIDNLSEE